MFTVLPLRVSQSVGAVGVPAVHRLPQAPPLLHPQPLCCHLLTRGRLSRAFLLVGWICCAVPRPMRSVVRAAGGECGSRATSEQQRPRLEVVPARWRASFPQTWRKYVATAPIYTTGVNSCHLILSFILPSVWENTDLPSFMSLTI